jgi:hypothetical protein
MAGLDPIQLTWVKHAYFYLPISPTACRTNTGAAIVDSGLLLCYYVKAK